MIITHLWRYPVKSLAGERLTSTRVEHGGIPFDRGYVIIDKDSARKGQELTARQVAALLAYQAGVANGAVSVKSPDGALYAVDDVLLGHLESALQRPLSVLSAAPNGQPFHDAYDILVINAASVRALESEWNKPVNPLRFRPNIMLDGDDATPYVENDWVGRELRVGDAIFEGVELDVRCAITTIDPQTLAKDPSFLELLTVRHNACFGLYCRVQMPGTIAVGDEWQICR